MLDNQLAVAVLTLILGIGIVTLVAVLVFRYKSKGRSFFEIPEHREKREDKDDTASSDIRGNNSNTVQPRSSRFRRRKYKA